MFAASDIPMEAVMTIGVDKAKTFPSQASEMAMMRATRLINSTAKPLAMTFLIFSPLLECHVESEMM
jgi:hypothetical protein